MGWFSSSKKTALEPINPRGTLLGLDLNAGRARASTGRLGKNRVLLLDDPQTDLFLTISLEKKYPEVGQAGIRLLRRLPHLTCSGYLPYLGQPNQWAGGRHTLDAVSALTVAFDRLRSVCQGFEGLGLALPSYLLHPQVAKLLPILQKAKLPIYGTAISALALAAERAIDVLTDAPSGSQPENWVVPLHRGTTPSATVLLIDVDEYALTGTLLKIEIGEVNVVQSASYPRLGTKVWKDRLLDAISDRCIRMCRRDPRDSAEAEQALYEQLEESLDRIYHRQKVALTVRSQHWYQDLLLQPEEFDAFCITQLRGVVDAMKELMFNAGLVEPPRAVWLTHDTARLPGIGHTIFQHMAERTAIHRLPPEAIAIAIANLAERWKLGELPRVHLDTTIPLPKLALEMKPTNPQQVKHKQR